MKKSRSAGSSLKWPCAVWNTTVSLNVLLVQVGRKSTEKALTAHKRRHVHRVYLLILTLALKKTTTNNPILVEHTIRHSRSQQSHRFRRDLHGTHRNLFLVQLWICTMKIGLTLLECILCRLCGRHLHHQERETLTVEKSAAAARSLRQSRR